MEKIKLTIIATGGTIAAASTTEGDRPTLSMAKIMNQIPILRDRFDPKVVPLMQKDSTLIDNKDWVKIAKETYHASIQGSAVLITHGTDTLAYTSAALSFAIQNPQTSIALTGSMKMLEDKETDVVRNLSDTADWSQAAQQRHHNNP